MLKYTIGNIELVSLCRNMTHLKLRTCSTVKEESNVYKIYTVFIH